MVTRRTTQRMGAFPPGEQTRELFGYMAVKAAQDHGVRLVMGTLMSNHVHLMAVDEKGSRSKWMQQMFSTTARKQNFRINRRENLWGQDGPNVMAILDIDKLCEQVTYTALQAVAAGLVAKVETWSGFKILPRDWGKPMRFERPRECGPDMPEYVEFTPMPPPGFEGLPLEDVIAFFENMIAAKEREYASKRRFPVVGIKTCEKRSPYWTPTTKAPMRRRKPRFTSCDPKASKRARAHLKEFNEKYRAALEAFRGGNRNTVFPAGTIKMAQLGCPYESTAPDHPLAFNERWTHRMQSSWDTWLASR